MWLLVLALALIFLILLWILWVEFLPEGECSVRAFQRDRSLAASSCAIMVNLSLSLKSLQAQTQPDAV